MTLLKCLKTGLMFLTYPISPRQRDWRIYQELVKNGGATTSDKILTTEFNDVARLGLDPAKLPRHTITSKNFFQDKTVGPVAKIFMSLTALGYVHGMRVQAQAEDRNGIYMNRALFNPIAQYFMAKMAIGVAMPLVVFTAAGQFMEWLATQSILSKIWAFTSLRLMVYQQILTMPVRSFANTFGHEHIHVLQKKWGCAHPGTYNPLEGDFKNQFNPEQLKDPVLQTYARFDGFASFGLHRYLRNDAEIQARLHTVLVQGVPRWNRLPQNKMELWAAMSDSGVSLPRSIRKEMETKHKDAFKKACQVMNADGNKYSLRRLFRQAALSDVYELNIAQRSLLASEYKTAFWQTALPYIYGHLLELYGDADGRRKMGFTASDAPDLALRHV